MTGNEEAHSSQSPSIDQEHKGYGDNVGEDKNISNFNGDLNRVSANTIGQFHQHIYNGQSNYSHNYSTPETLKKSKTRKVVVIEGELDAISEAQLKAFLKILQKKGYDLRMEIEKVEEGSIKITINGTEEGLQRIQELFDNEELDEIEGFQILEVRDLTEIEKEEVDKKALRGTNLSKTNLSEANLSDPNLSGVYLDGSILDDENNEQNSHLSSQEYPLNPRIRQLLDSQVIAFLDFAIERAFEEISKNFLTTNKNDVTPYLIPAFEMFCNETNLTQKQIAKKLGISESKISKYIKGSFERLFIEVKKQVTNNCLYLVIHEINENNLFDNPKKRLLFDYLTENYLSSEVFTLEQEKLRDSRTRQFKGLYFKRLHHYLNQLQSTSPSDGQKSG